MAALVIGITSPAIGLYALWGPMQAAAGPVAPLVFLAALVINLPTVLSYASLNRHAPSAGAAATWLWTTMGPVTGLAAGMVMTTYFIMGAITVPLMFGLFFRDLLDWAHIPLPGMAALVIGLLLHSAITAWICLRGAEASIKTTIRLMLIEAGVVFALSATILWVKASQPGAINLGPFNPAHASQGMAGFWTAVLLGTCWPSPRLRRRGDRHRRGHGAARTCAPRADRRHHRRRPVLGLQFLGADPVDPARTRWSSTTPKASARSPRWPACLLGPGRADRHRHRLLPA